MNRDDLLDAIGEADDSYVRDAKERRKRRAGRAVAWTSLVAACLVLAMGVRLVFGGSNAGNGGNGSLVYMAYAGPVLPMTVQGDADGITAQRNINFDFSPYVLWQGSYEHEGETVYYDQYASKSLITDSYTLTNETAEERTVTLLYPVAGSLQREAEVAPEIKLAGLPVESTMYAGPYLGTFEGAWGAEDQETGSLNRKGVYSFEGYEELLSDGSYQEGAFDAFPSLDQSVVVYQIGDYGYTSDETAASPTLQMSFYMDYDKTDVLTFGMNGNTWDSESGYRACHVGGIKYRPNVDEKYQHPDDAYVLVLGEDITGYEMQGYRDGGCDAGEELYDLTCTVTRYETTLSEILTQFIELQMETQGEDTQRYLGLLAELLYSSGLFSEDQVQRYDSGMVDMMISDVYTNGRLLYYAFDATIPAGETIEVEVSLEKQASVDYVGEDQGKDGYDLATQLGSNLTFTKQTASIANYEEIEIVGQNFGFDPANGVISVTLDLNTPQYWLEVVKVYPEEE